jgi:hypothetical protein
MTTRKPITFTGVYRRLIQAGETLLLMASSSGAASLNLPHGTAPTSPADGDVWTTSSGMFVRVNGTTVGPLIDTGGGGGGSSGLLFSITADAGNANDTTEDTIASYTMPGGTLANDGDSLEITATVELANNNHSKAFRVRFGSSNFGGVSGNVVPVANNRFVFKYLITRRSASSQQETTWGMNYQGSTPTLSTSSSFLSFTSAAEALGSNVTIIATGQTGTAAANDVVLKQFTIRKL